MNTTLTPSPDQWESFVSHQPRAHVLQQSAWGTLKSRYGWDCERVAIAGESGQIVSGAQLLFRRLPLGLGTMVYLPMGPLGDVNAALWQAVHKTARRHRAAFLKWEPGLALDGEILPDPRVFGFRLSQQTIQPPRTVLIDLSGSDEAILARMNQGTRRKIRQSQKNDILYQEASRADIAAFTAMMQTTGTRNAFGVHEPDYYAAAYDLFVPQGHAALIVASHEGDPLAGIMVFVLGSSAWYLYGASADTRRNLMAAYGVQWAAIQWAKAKGCRWYDMWGIPDADEAILEAQFESRSDGLWGVYGFKRGWGGQVVRSLGAWDHVYNPLLYAAYQLALRVRQ